MDGLRERGVEWMAALCGHGLDPLFGAARKAGIRIIDVRNEQTAGYMADAWGRLTRRPGVCASSSGVAVVNALTGVMNAWFDHAPMLYISGTAASTTLGLGAFQDSDHIGLARPVTKISASIDHPQRALQMLDQAWEAAKAWPSGPVHLQFPMDVQTASVEEGAVVRGTGADAATGPNRSTVDAVAKALAAAERPLIIAGSHTYYSGEAQELAYLAERYSIPVQIPIWDRGLFDSACDCFMGVIGAATGGPALIDQSDCVIVSADVDYRVGYLHKTPKAHRMAGGWRQLTESLTGKPWQAWLQSARRQRDEYTKTIAQRAESQRVPGRMHAADVVTTVGEVLPSDGSLLIDGGSIGQWAHQLLCHHRYPSYWLTCGRSGVVGWGLGGAMAARLAFPEKPVVLLSGDGAFTFTVAELECAVRQKLPFVAVVADDQCWGITHSGHLKQFGEGIATQLGSIRFAQLAESMGARGISVDTKDELAAALRESIGRREVTVIHAPISGGNPV